MCGIAGVLGHTDEAAVHRMVDAMRQRGPDDAGIHVDEEHGVVLGNTRLAIIDLSHDGHMPMADVSGRCWITYNGEIYNHAALRTELRDRGFEFRSRSDTEVVLAAYLEWGRDCVHRLRGMYAFALHDARNRVPVTLLVRDRLGIKPIYWAQTANAVVFASEIKALLASRLIEPVADRQAIWDYLSWGCVPGPGTIIRGVSAVPPGHALNVSGIDAKLWTYWTPRPASGPAPVYLPDAAAELRALLADSVAEHMVADVPVGAFLSGGVDSAATVALASQLSPRPLQTFTVAFGQGPAVAAELRHAAGIAKRFGTDHREVSVSGHEVAAAYPEFIGAMDQPTVDGLNIWVVSRAAADRVTVALSGLGADELWAGYPQFARFQRVGRRLQGGLPALRPLVKLSNRILPGRIAGPMRFWAGTRRERHLQIRDPLPRLTAGDVLADRSFASGLQEPARVIPPVAFDDPVLDTSMVELTTYLPNVLLRDTDAMSMAHSLEVRVPYLDHRIVESALQLPASFKRVNGIGKAVLRSALADLLPEGTVVPGKSYFSFPLLEWVKGPLRGPIDQALRSPTGRELFDAGAVSDLTAAAMNGRGMAAYTVGVLAGWMEEHRVLAWR